MRERGNALHLDRIHLLKRMIKDPWCVDDLPPQILVVEVTDEERLGGESVWLHVDIRTRYFINEGRLPDVRVSAYEERARVGVDSRETGYMLSHLLEVGEGIFLASHNRRHAAIATLVPREIQ